MPHIVTESDVYASNGNKLKVHKRKPKI